MFNKKDKKVELLEEENNKLVKEYNEAVHKLEEKHKEEIEEILRRNELENELIKKRHDFEIEHFETNKIAQLNKELNEYKTKNAVQAQEISNLKKAIDWNADIVDVKELVNGLMSKLPNVDLKNLSVNVNGQK